MPIHPGHHHRVREGGHDFDCHLQRVERPALEGHVRGGRRRLHAPRRRSTPALTHEPYEATMASFIRPRLFSAESVTLCVQRGEAPQSVTDSALKSLGLMKEAMVASYGS